MLPSSLRQVVSRALRASATDRQEGLLSDITALQSARDRKRGVVSLFFASPFVTSAIPRLTWLFFFLLVIVLIATYLRQGNDWRRLLRPNSALIAVLLAALFAVLSVIWAADRSAAFAESSLLIVVILASLAATKALTALDEQQVRRAAIGFAIGAFLGALFVLIELLTDGALTRTAMNLITVLQPERAKHHLVMVQGRVLEINLSLLNRNVALVMFHLWPALLVLRVVERGRRAIALIGLFFLATAIPVIISEHQSSQFALVVSLIIFPLGWFWRRETILALAAFWCVAFVLVLPLDFLAFKANLHMAPWLPSSARARVILWEYTAERVFDHAWLGIGAASTPALKEPRAMAERPKGFVLPRTTGQHAHDLFLQTWYELGAIGVILTAVAGAAVALRLLRLPFEAQPFAAASFATFVAMAAFSWGIWQEWLMCAVALLWIYLTLAKGLLRQQP
jgi:hypothetical protein